ncbi:LPXTG cell wall anchor domain-containing protein [Actinoplanes sp. TRM 88003]|uniref:LPXTG cell wall anchor domain-containing protein n=1 Tax=Paractinoplanes aksuensis TaxID=2939490 RepID=A0ABT1DJU0_9ACTN|nr:LPXTG cell wall anchor domain-containing protein [Actinoplanes aksuensis]MCO8271103.1 LPXTG cell wall anchor domain-containing protein [Actinoplanes aksuensis]
MRRLVGAALITLLAALAPAAAAQAAPAWDYELSLAHTSLAPGTAKSMRVHFNPPTTNPPRDYRLVFDFSALSGIATLTPWPSARCTTTATTLDCPAVYEAQLVVTAAPGAELGASAKVTVRGVLGTRTLATTTATVTVAEQAALTAVDAQDDLSVATGGTTGLSAAVRNTGDRPVTGVVLQLRTAIGIRSAGHSNCVPITAAPTILQPQAGAACLFDAELAPGQTYRLATPWQVTATDAVWAPSEWISSFTWYTAQDYQDLGRPLPAGGSGPELELAPVAAARAVPQTEPDTLDNADDWSLSVTGDNRSPFTVKGTTATGTVGRTVTARLSVRNEGPARLESWGHPAGGYLTVTVRPPAGTTVVKHPDRCEPFVSGYPGPDAPWPPGVLPNDGNYYCFTDFWRGNPYLPGRTETFDFTFRVDKPGTLRGEIRTELHSVDVKRQQAPIVITATAAGAGDDGGGEGGGGSLPITGSNTAVVALIGLTLLVAGGAARLATRRH